MKVEKLKFPELIDMYASMFKVSKGEAEQVLRNVGELFNTAILDGRGFKIPSSISVGVKENVGRTTTNPREPETQLFIEEYTSLTIKPTAELKRMLKENK